MGSTPYWDYKPTNAIHVDRPGVYSTDKFLILSRIDKNLLKGDVIDVSLVSGLKQPNLYSFMLDKPPGYKGFLSLKQYTVNLLSVI